MNRDRLEKNVALSFIVAFGIILISPVLYITIKGCNSSPVEETKKIEQIDKTNIIIDTEIKLLDSIKNEEIIEVKNLNDDSTLVLFYKLIGK